MVDKKILHLIKYLDEFVRVTKNCREKDLENLSIGSHIYQRLQGEIDAYENVENILNAIKGCENDL